MAVYFGGFRLEVMVIVVGIALCRDTGDSTGRFGCCWWWLWSIVGIIGVVGVGAFDMVYSCSGRLGRRGARHSCPGCLEQREGGDLDGIGICNGKNNVYMWRMNSRFKYQSLAIPSPLCRW